MSIYEQRPSTQGEHMNNPFVASFTPEFPFAVDPSAYGAFSSQPDGWRRSSGLGGSGRRLPPPYEDERFDSPPPPPAKALPDLSTAAAAPAVSLQPTVFTIDETGRPVGLGNQTWDSFGKDSTRNVESTSSVSESSTKGHGDIFDTYYPPTVSLSTGDRFSQLLEAKLGLDSAIQTPKSTASNLNRQHRIQSLPSTGAFEPLVAGGTSLVAEASSSSLNARHSYSSTSDTPWIQATSQLSTPSQPDGTGYSLKPQDPFSLERALQDPSQLQIPPDLVAAMPDMARYPWQLPAQPQGQAQMVNGFFGQAPFAVSSQSPVMPSQEAFIPDQMPAQHAVFAYQAFNVSLPGMYSNGAHVDFGSGGMSSAPMPAMPNASIPTAGYTTWSATPYQAGPSAFAPTTHPLLPSTAGLATVPRDTHDAPGNLVQIHPLAEAQRASPQSRGQSGFERSPSLSAAKVTNANKPFSQNAVAGPSASRKRRVSAAIDDGESRSDSSPGMLAPSGSRSSLHEEGGEEKKPIVIACHNCRAKKLKCDGARPKCHHCCRRNQPVCEYDSFLRRRGPGKKSKKKRRQEPWEAEYAHDADADDDAEYEHLAMTGQPSHGGEQEVLFGYPQDRPSETFVPYMNDRQAMTAANAYWSGRHPV